MKKQIRYLNLDLLRALAVMMVVFYHCCNLSGVPHWLWKWTETMGSNSVELFCILSGFLIGSLYWEEHDRNTMVNIRVFILRRIYRTVPMYYFFMILAYIPVYLIRQQEFSWYYLVFLQNYHLEIPFYVISWTLCVEEHFYILLPFLLWVFLRANRMFNISIIFVLLIIPPLCRLLFYDNSNGSFGYYGTATHFRYESLLLGVIISYLIHYNKTMFAKIVDYRYIIYVMTVVIISSFALLPAMLKAYISASVSSYLFMFVVLLAVNDVPYRLSTHPLIYKIAISSYSTYLGHSLVLHVCMKAFSYAGIETSWIKIPIMFVISFAVGYVIFLKLEKPIIKLRNKHIPAP
jgi:peptidoglycan/LPS O-acetylase OafA/YrhL